MGQNLDKVQEEPDAVVDQTATVTEARAMDDDRTDEVFAELGERWEHVSTHVDADEPETIRGWRQVVDELSEVGEDYTAGEIERLLDRAERAHPSLLGLRFAPNEQHLQFDPGQYVRISFDDEEPRVYSIASSPNDDEMELCITRVPGGELTPSLLDEVDSRDELFVRGPFGDELSLFHPSERSMVFVATGTGAAPLHSMIQYTFEEGLDTHDGEKRDVWLFLGASWRDDLPYHEEFGSLAAEYDHFHYVPTLSRERLLDEWAGETNYVQQTLVKYLADDVDRSAVPESLHEYLHDDRMTDIEARLDPATTELYVCGVGVMCDSVVDVTDALGLDEQFTKVESYG